MPGWTAYSTFEELATAWLTEYREDAENGIYSFTTVDSHSDNLRKHVLPVLGNLTIIETLPPVINGLCQAKLKANSLSLAKQIKAVIGNVMTYAVQAGLIEQNPVREIAPLSERRAKVKKAKPRSLTRVELLELLGQALDSRRRGCCGRICRIWSGGFMATGERRGEMLWAPTGRTSTRTALS